MKRKIAVVRGKFLNAYEMQSFEPLAKQFALTGFGSLSPFHDSFSFPVVKLISPMDLPDFPYKMQLLNRIFRDAHYLFGLEQRLRGFDLVHTAETYYFYTHQALQAKKKGYVKKVIATVLENIPFNNEGIYGRTALKQQAREELDHMIALTQKAKETLLLEGADETKISVIGFGIDIDRFKRQKKMWNDNSIVILFCGRLEKEKGIFDILFSAKKLLFDPSLKEYSLEFSFVGAGSQKQALESLAKRLGIFQHIRIGSSSYEKMPNVYQDADIFVAPSQPTRFWQEQFGMVILEAMASGLPIVTTQSGSIQEVVSDAAVCVPASDYLSLAQVLKQFILLPNLAKSFGEKARNRAERVFDRKHISQRIASVYESVLA